MFEVLDFPTSASLTKRFEEPGAVPRPHPTPRERATPEQSSSDTTAAPLVAPKKGLQCSSNDPAQPRFTNSSSQQVNAPLNHRRPKTSYSGHKPVEATARRHHKTMRPSIVPGRSSSREMERRRWKSRTDGRWRLITLPFLRLRFLSPSKRLAAAIHLPQLLLTGLTQAAQPPRPHSHLRVLEQCALRLRPHQARVLRARLLVNNPALPGTPNGQARIPRPDQNSSTPPRYPNGSTRPPNGQTQAQPPSRLPAPVKPLNVASSTAQDPVKAAEAALTAKPPATERKQDVRMSTMSENEVMAKLKEVVSKKDPTTLYSKQKKIGQGASGSVYVAKVNPRMVNPALALSKGSSDLVAIKQMDLAHQPPQGADRQRNYGHERQQAPEYRQLP